MNYGLDATRHPMSEHPDPFQAIRLLQHRTRVHKVRAVTLIKPAVCVKSREMTASGGHWRLKPLATFFIETGKRLMSVLYRVVVWGYPLLVVVAWKAMNWPRVMDSEGWNSSPLASSRLANCPWLEGAACMLVLVMLLALHETLLFGVVYFRKIIMCCTYIPSNLDVSQYHLWLNSICIL